jgi:D-glycero-D-manno-heptose 1,7-bisphosphate phosphatase
MKAIFLDRDGVINKYPGDKKYVTSWKKFKFLPRARLAIAKLHQHNFKLFVISNQAGVGKGIYSKKTLNAITKKMLIQIRKLGGNLDGIYYCTHRKEEDCSCRKPKTGLLNAIKEKYPLNFKNAYFIGDTIPDINTARAVGCKSILVLCGKEKLKNRKNWEEQPDFIFNNLYEATNFILKENR